MMPLSGPPPAVTSDADIRQLEALLSALPPTLDPPDVSALDGFLCGVLLQPEPVAARRWQPYVADLGGRLPPRGVDLSELTAIVTRRHRELDAAIAGRRWFDPWVFELDAAASVSSSLCPWVAGFALAVERFDRLLALEAPALREPLALLYQHLPAEDLEVDADLQLLLDASTPPNSLGDAVEDLVCAVLLLADIGRPIKPAAGSIGNARSVPSRRRRTRRPVS